MRPIATLLALLFPLALAGCPSIRPVPGDDDDDDSAVDDDDTVDDDDATADDDDSAADDDDATSDDDDATADDDDATPEPDGTSALDGHFVLSYTDSLNNNELICAQAYEFQFTGTFNANAMGSDCVMCRGRLEVLFAQDVTDTWDDPQLFDVSGDPSTPCDPFADFPGVYGLQNFGDTLFDPLTNPGGDFLNTIGLIPEDLATGNQLQVSTMGQTVAEVFQNPPVNGSVATHVGMYVMDESMYFVTGSNLNEVAVEIPGTPPNSTAIFWFFWSTPSNEDVVGMNGEYFVQGAWTLGVDTDGDGSANYNLSFFGRLAGQFTPTP